MTGEESCLAFKERGHGVPLFSTQEPRLGGAVHVRELDHANERVAHEILTDIMTARAAKEIDTLARYKGKKPLWWLGTVYPEAATPRFLSLFNEQGTLLGWAALSTTPSLPKCAVLGAIVRPPFRNFGLGWAIVEHCRKYAREVLDDTTLADLFFDTREQNTQVLRIVEKVGMTPARERVDINGNRMIGFSIPLVDG
ncbi:MAG TPA: GNAT family N-acetyltransferase [Candidatus Lokiarchaeia archaeon]|nr:GNAT family N-acetyltransferase [Candidatus Lokiarchaeia archaeon]